jgi:DNA-binding transcriptional LysR family regulator
MNLRQLEAFRAVRTTGSTTRAADRMGLTQSSVSRLIIQLEEHIGYQLFDRQGGRMKLTPEGQEFYAVAENVFGNLDRIEQMAKNLRQRSANWLRIAAMPAIGTCMLPKAVKEFLDAFPNSRLTIDLKSRADLQHAIAVGEYDLGLVTLPVTDDELDVSPLCTVEAVCIVPCGHRLANSEAVSFSDLADERLISISSNTLLRFLIENALNEANVALKTVCEAESTMLVGNLVAEGAGVAIVHSAVAKHFANRLAVLKLSPCLELKYGVIQRKGLTQRALAQQFIEMLGQILETETSAA